MNRADCKNCSNRVNRRYEDSQDYTGDCAFGMRFASTAGGGEPDDLCDVYFCRDHQPEEDEEIL